MLPADEARKTMVSTTVRLLWPAMLEVMSDHVRMTAEPKMPCSQAQPMSRIIFSFCSGIVDRPIIPAMPGMSVRMMVRTSVFLTFDVK